MFHFLFFTTFGGNRFVHLLASVFRCKEEYEEEEEDNVLGEVEKELSSVAVTVPTVRENGEHVIENDTHELGELDVGY